MCQCNCGSEPKYFRGERLRNGHFQNCGCVRKKAQGVNHGLTNTKLYKTYNSMKKRCYKKENNPDYKNYGGRGILICEEWLNDHTGFINFYNWAINNGYQDNLTIERKDVNGNYEPDNCTWADRKVQNNNRTNNKLITIGGLTKNVSQWAEEYNLPNTTIWSRLRRGKTEIELIRPVQFKNSNFKGVI